MVVIIIPREARVPLPLCVGWQLPKLGLDVLLVRSAMLRFGPNSLVLLYQIETIVHYLHLTTSIVHYLHVDLMTKTLSTRSET